MSQAITTRLLFLVVFLLPWKLFGQNEPPQKLTSPDGNYSVEIVHQALPGADSLEEFTLMLSTGDKTVAKAPTFGFLTAAHWSDDGKYVAINNRRGNSGDYVWVFDLQAGKALKRPDDKFGEAWNKAAAAAVRKKLPSANENTLVRSWLTAKGWKDGRLLFVDRSIYRGAKQKYDFEAAADPSTWEIKTSNLVERSLDE